MYKLLTYRKSFKSHIDLIKLKDIYIKRMIILYLPLLWKTQLLQLDINLSIIYSNFLASSNNLAIKTYLSFNPFI